MKDVMKAIKSDNFKTVIMDIDGTIKDLVLEHTVALKDSLEVLCPNKRIRQKMVWVINKLGMFIIKNGIITTNYRRQKTLIRIYGIILNVPYKKFIKQYMLSFCNQRIFFEESLRLLVEVDKDVDLYFATTNMQNLKLQDNSLFKEKIYCLVEKPKRKIYENIITKNNLNESKVLIVGDNFHEDVISAKRLKVKVICVNMYNALIKRIFKKILKV